MLLWNNPIYITFCQMTKWLRKQPISPILIGLHKKENDCWLYEIEKEIENENQVSNM